MCSSCILVSPQNVHNFSERLCYFYLETTEFEEISDDSGKDTICFAAHSACGTVTAFFRDFAHCRFIESIDAYGILLVRYMTKCKLKKNATFYVSP